VDSPAPCLRVPRLGGDSGFSPLQDCGPATVGGLRRVGSRNSHLPLPRRSRNESPRASRLFRVFPFPVRFQPNRLPLRTLPPLPSSRRRCSSNRSSDPRPVQQLQPRSPRFSRSTTFGTRARPCRRLPPASACPSAGRTIARASAKLAEEDKKSQNAAICGLI
jgi:hypothetical protein